MYLGLLGNREAVHVISGPLRRSVLSNASQLAEKWSVLEDDAGTMTLELHSDSLTWKWKMVPWKTVFLYKQGDFQ